MIIQPVVYIRTKGATLQDPVPAVYSRHRVSCVDGPTQLPRGVASGATPVPMVQLLLSARLFSVNVPIRRANVRTVIHDASAGLVIA
jgi:hypothetical protein